jgi:hypothetical protein
MRRLLAAAALVLVAGCSASRELPPMDVSTWTAAYDTMDPDHGAPLPLDSDPAFRDRIRQRCKDMRQSSLPYRTPTGPGEQPDRSSVRIICELSGAPLTEIP